MAQFDEVLADGQCFLCVEAECSNFSFGCLCHDVLDDFGKDYDGAIELCFVCVAQKMVSSCSASCVGTVEIRSITVHLKDHVTGAVDALQAA